MPLKVRTMRGLLVTAAKLWGIVSHGGTETARLASRLVGGYRNEGVQIRGLKECIEGGA